ncbi:Inositol monophosphatase 1 [Gracilariopsis chorda]|uniref:Inositol-1-monophosphatase n=1 Tax=Gracilariopsis chorda TaxID=448386 RepID=A0A2V3IXJ2_9FLOR|nr:Inositol monophosphatase 1 [Gracilariopsis chorda]|eukprot:PXF46783.1 Inositol monophosphatase 1 [Gracilariopsis chorda]
MSTPFAATAAQKSNDHGEAAVDDLHTLHLLAMRLARESGDIIMSLRFAPPPSTAMNKWHNSMSLSVKSDSSDLVTTADHASQEHIFSFLRAAYPSHNLIGEESVESHTALDERPTWIVDAIDGTTNYVHAIPHFAVCIAFAVERVVQIGVVYNPATKEMFHAVRGKGAFVNGQAIECSKTTRLKEALILSEWGYVRDEGASSMLAPNERLLVNGVRGVRQLGSGALDICYVAAGMADAVYCGVERDKRDKWHVWDYAAASVVAEEAGAVLRSVDGGAFDIEGDSMFCSTPALVDRLLAIVGTQ